MKEGEIVLLRYPKQFRDDYCLAKITEAKAVNDGLIRKVTVSFRKRNPRESAEVSSSKPLILEELAVHRLQRLDIIDEGGEDQVVGHAEKVELGTGTCEDQSNNGGMKTNPVE